MRQSLRRPLTIVTLLASAAGASGWVGTASAQPATAQAQRSVGNAGGPSWQALTAPQRGALAPLQADWNGIDATRKAKWLEIAGRFPQLPAAEQQRLQARMGEWARLSPSERARARLNFQETKQISPEERQAKWQAYQALPEPERKALAQRAAPVAGQRAAPNAAAGPVPGGPSAKRNIVANPSLSAPPQKAVAPTVVQAAPGATTSLVTRQATPPPHQQTGMPKIAATPGFVDRRTLLPKRGPQGAATRSASNTQQQPPPPTKTP